jgi:CRP-like cAMP-binding protein
MIQTQKVALSSCSLGSNKAECFSLLLPDELDFLYSKMTDVFYNKGEVVFKQGSFAGNVMILQEGLVKTYIEGLSDNLVLQIFSPVTMIGLTALSELSHVRLHSAQVYVDSRLSLIEINALKQVMAYNPSFSSKLVSMLAEQLIIVSGRFYCLTKKQTYGRFADVLLCLSNRIYKSRTFPLLLSRKDLAELTGMTIESVSRIITKFKSDGIIKIENDFIEILDIEKLELISLKG